ncbi:MAG: DUF922 domain-containing protein [Pseudomonadota bacterium]
MKVTLSCGKPTYKTYTVKGTDAPAVVKALNKSGEWGKYRPHFDFSASGKTKTAIDTVKVFAKPVITLPKWANYRKITKGQNSWDTMFKALKKHEENHHAIFDAAAKGFKAALERGGDLEPKQFSQAWASFEAEVEKAQKAYDRRTKHGQTEGVILNVW